MSFEDILGPGEEELAELAELLSSTRPSPEAGWRGQLGRHLDWLEMPMSAARLWPLVALLAILGLIALGIATLGVLGHGPFAAG